MLDLAGICCIGRTTLVLPDPFSKGLVQASLYMLPCRHLLGIQCLVICSGSNLKHSILTAKIRNFLWLCREGMLPQLWGDSGGLTFNTVILSI